MIGPTIVSLGFTPRMYEEPLLFVILCFVFDLYFLWHNQQSGLLLTSSVYQMIYGLY